MTPDQFYAYAAGLFDGEGCVVIAPSRKNVLVRIVMTNPEPVTRCFNYWGGSFSSHDYPPRRRLYAWGCSGTNAFVFLRHIQPYVMAKRNQVNLALEFQSKRELLDEETREWYKQKLSSLKKVAWSEGFTASDIPETIPWSQTSPSFVLPNQ